MKKKWIFGAAMAAVIVVVVVIGCVLWFSSSATIEGAKPKPVQATQSPQSPTASAAPADHKLKMSDLSDAQKEEGRKELDFLYKKLATGSEDIHPASKYLQKAIDTRDKSQILQAFTRLYWSRLWPMSEVVPTLKGFLSNDDPFVRFVAAQSLFKVGDQSGYATLLALVQSNTPIEGIGQDVRIQAAQDLAQFGQTDAASAIANLYATTHSGDLSQALANLGVPLPGESQLPFVSSSLAITEYAKVGATQFIPQITSTFYNTQQTDVKVAAAWALATMTNDQNAINYLVQEGQTGLTNPSAVDGPTERSVIQYLGSIQNPAAKQTLEAALGSSDPTIVQTAIVNLIYNQGGSDKAVQVIANQLNDPAKATLPWDFTLNVAAQLTSNPTIQSAGQSFAQHDATGDWQTYTVERQNWPVSNWIGGYVVKLKK
jgi:HEAT repeat protein